jgi:hypothetical protein
MELCQISLMKLNPFGRNLVLKSGLSLIGVGLLSIVVLLLYNHGLEDTLPLALYLIAYIAIPVGLLFWLVGVVVNLLRARSQE